jgi:adenosylmethionine-8-amino-7-oxononanoate aminotransferase
MSPGIRDMVIQDSLVHANTWAGHPVACAAALATLDILEREDLCAQAARKGELLRDAIDDVQSRNDCILRSSSLGLLASIEYRLPGDDGGKRAATRLRHDLCTRGVFARVGISAPNVGFTTYYPALVIDDADITRSIAALDSGIRAVQ